MCLRTNSVAGFGDKCAQAESADDNIAVHPVTSESASWETLGVGLDPGLHPNQLEFLLIDTGARAGQISKVDSLLSDWYGSLANQFLPVAKHRNEDGWSRRLRGGIVSRYPCFALEDGASVLIVSRTGAVTMSPTGGVVLVSPAIFNVVAFNSEEPIEDLSSAP